MTRQDLPDLVSVVPKKAMTEDTPADVIAKLETATRASVADPTLQSRMLALGLEPAPMTTAEFGKFIADEIEKWAKVIKFAHFSI